MSTVQIGFYGKLPSHGDFLRRRASDAFVNVWDPWLQQCLVESRARLEGDWLAVYLTSPMWRFVLAEGVMGAASYAGVMLPSVDRVGRYFPFTIVAELPAELSPVTATIHGRQWFRSVEALTLAALDSQDFSLEAFDAALLETSSELAVVERRATVALDESFPHASFHWRLPIESSDRVAAALIDPLMATVSRTLRPMSLWWTEGSERVGASCLLARALPEASRFTAMLNGSWQDGGWAGEPSDLVREAAEDFQYRAVSAGITDIGHMRKVNEDALLDRADLGIWAVADGMGGHSHGAEASQMVIDALASLVPTATVSSALSAAREVLERVNADLIRSALRVEDTGQSGSTVVFLSVRQVEWGVLWAGDSRAYLLREGVLSALTRDHSEAAGAQEDVDDTTEMPPPSSGVITRAVGGHPALVVDQNSGALMPGDRFFLCSDGVHGVVSHERLTAILMTELEPKTAVERIIGEANAAPSRDNLTALVVDIVI